MAFLFKSKKSHDRALASRDGNTASQASAQGPGPRFARDDKNALQQRATPTGSLNSVENEGSVDSPDRGHGRRGGSADTTKPGELSLRNGMPPTNPNASLYPWSQRRLTYTSPHMSPFPRYGAAVNATSSKEGDIYMMGGLINSSIVKGDLWMMEAGGSMACYPLAITAEGPGPRVGHASLLVGNAFIVYGGDTKVDESDVLDETLYLLNTSTRHWSRALPAEPRPCGRYGHSLNILGSKIYIFGGQVEGYFMNDLSAFDLNQLQVPSNQWDILMPRDPSPNVPAARTNHTVITFNDKMYLFGGTNGFQWFNDVWCYDPACNAWSQLDCIGYIPAPREGHAAALVDDVMYVFGGRTEEGIDLGDLVAFRITSRRWYTFQNMGPSPSPRSGHSMTTVGKSIVVLGGEPSSAAAAINDLGILYALDTTKIRYPNDGQQSANRLPAAAQRPGGAGDASHPTNRQNPSSREPPTGPHDPRKSTFSPPSAGNRPNGHKSPTPGSEASANPQSGPHAPHAAKFHRAAGTMSPVDHPMQGHIASSTGPEASAGERARGNSADRAGTPTYAQARSNQPAGARDAEAGAAAVNGWRPPTHLAKAASRNDLGSSPEPAKLRQPRHGQSPGSADLTADPGARPPRPSSPPHPTGQPSNRLSRRSSGRNSQTVVLLKELDSARNKSAWYASELELARKAGYVSTANLSPTLDAKAAETFDDEDRPLIEALLAMRTELGNVQSAVDKQAVVAAKQIAEAEKQRDVAVQEAVYAQAKLAAMTGGSARSTPQGDVDRDALGDRAGEVGKKLASALQVQRTLQLQLDSVTSELDAERKARRLADDTASVAQDRLADLGSYKQQNSTALTRLKDDLLVAQREAREHSAARAEAVAELELLKIDKAEVASKYSKAVGSSKDHTDTLHSLQSAVVASGDARAHLEKRLEQERVQRETVEAKLSTLRTEHEACAAELEASKKRLKDAEELAEKHAHEARTHRQAVISGLDKLSPRDVPASNRADAERLAQLQKQAASSSALMKKYKDEADAAAEKLRAAEERITGLEQYQEQASREGLAIRRQLQTSLREVQSLQAAHSEAQHRLAAQQLETNAMAVQHNALKGILSERGISPTSGTRAPGARPLEPSRSPELEAQLEEAKQAFAAQAQESETAYRDKLAQLESDYQSAVHYVKGTEKMLKQLKDQLTRYKTDNGRLKTEIEELESQLQEGGGGGGGERSTTAAGAWESERQALQHKVERLEAELKSSATQLEKSLETLRAEVAESKLQRDEALKSNETMTTRLQSSTKDLDQLQSENSLLEQRATDAEQKVSLLLDQVEHSVDNYRRRSRQIPSVHSEAVAGSEEHAAATPAAAAGGGGDGGHEHARQESSETGSTATFGGHSTDARNSAALDNLASELETLRSHWEATNKNYRLSNNFDFDQPAVSKKDDGTTSLGLSESLADWRKGLDTEDSHAGVEKPH